MASVFLRYALRADTLCLGERTRGGTFRPCSPVFRSTTLAGALKEVSRSSGPVYAVARFVPSLGCNRREILTLSPRHRAAGASVVPLRVEFFTNVEAEMFILKSESADDLPKSFNFAMGALRSKGFGRCEADLVEEVSCSEPVRGRLCVRIPDLADMTQAFGIRNVLSPVYGYLFAPTGLSTGKYVRALFENSEVVAYGVVLQNGGK